jgi:hypothetical protein
MSIHPLAEHVGSELGLDHESSRQIVQILQDQNPMVLIGGYNLDVLIIAAAAVLRLEDHMQTNPPVDLDPDCQNEEDRKKVIDTVQAIVEVAYGGAI